ncbi:MAG: TetR family transcriptional regulator [Gaiellaceae bacterium]
MWSGLIRTPSGDLYKPSAIRTYEAGLRLYIIPELGAARLQDVQRRDVQRLRVILYRHFDSKADLYRSVLDRAKQRLYAATGTPKFTDASIDALLAAAADDPVAFRLLFHHAAREPAFKEEMDRVRAEAIALTHRQLARVIPDRRWALGLPARPRGGDRAVTAWLDAGQPDHEEAAERIRRAIYGGYRRGGRALTATK